MRAAVFEDAVHELIVVPYGRWTTRKGYILAEAWSVKSEKLLDRSTESGRSGHPLLMLLRVFPIYTASKPFIHPFIQNFTPNPEHIRTPTALPPWASHTPPFPPRTQTLPLPVQTSLSNPSQ